ncbi:MAG TPA: hypothetical protein VGE41_04875 [Verrucomicrobiae bacterium]|jgi:hypothetical protein
MKTPRDLLIERHRAAEEKLAERRQQFVAGLARTQRSDALKPESTRSVASAREERSSAWREWFWSFRWHLTGLSAAWMIVFFLNMEHSSSRSPLITKRDLPTPQQFLVALQEHRRLLMEMLDLNSEPNVTPPSLPPARRSEIENTNTTFVV